MANKKPTFNRSKEAFAYLRARYGIPQSMLEQIRIALAEDALADGEDMGFNRLYTAVVLMMHRVYGLEGDELVKGLAGLDEIMDWVVKKGVSWEEIMKTTYEETGILVQHGADGDWIAEYKPQEKETDDS